MSNYKKMVRLLCDATTTRNGVKAARVAALEAYKLSKSCDDHQRGDDEICYALAFALNGGAL